MTPTGSITFNNGMYQLAADGYLKKRRTALLLNYDRAVYQKITIAVGSMSRNVSYILPLTWTLGQALCEIHRVLTHIAGMHHHVTDVPLLLEPDWIDHLYLSDQLGFVSNVHIGPNSFTSKCLRKAKEVLLRHHLPVVGVCDLVTSFLGQAGWSAALQGHKLSTITLDSHAINVAGVERVIQDSTVFLLNMGPSRFAIKEPDGQSWLINASKNILTLSDFASRHPLVDADWRRLRLDATRQLGVTATLFIGGITVKIKYAFQCKQTVRSILRSGKSLDELMQNILCGYCKYRHLGVNRLGLNPTSGHVVPNTINPFEYNADAEEMLQYLNSFLTTDCRVQFSLDKWPSYKSTVVTDRMTVREFVKRGIITKILSDGFKNTVTYGQMVLVVGNNCLSNMVDVNAALVERVKTEEDYATLKYIHVDFLPGCPAVELLLDLPMSKFVSAISNPLTDTLIWLEDTPVLENAHPCFSMQPDGTYLIQDELSGASFLSAEYDECVDAVSSLSVLSHGIFLKFPASYPHFIVDGEPLVNVPVPAPIQVFRHTDIDPMEILKLTESVFMERLHIALLVFAEKLIIPRFHGPASFVQSMFQVDVVTSRHRRRRRRKRGL